jgi:hypothetical protein
VKKFLLWTVVSVTLLGVVAAGVAYYKLNSILKAAIETVGPRITKTDVRVDAVALSPFSGSGSLRGLVIGNPAGFKEPAIMRLGSVKVRVDLKSLRGGTIVVKEIDVRAPEVDYEATLDKGTNVGQLQRNIASFSPPAPSAPKSPAAKSEPAGVKVIIERFRVSGGKVRVNLAGAVAAAAALPEIELRDIGKASGGATAAEAVQEMLGAIASGALKAAGSSSGSLQDAAKKAQGLLQGLFGKPKR